MNGEEGGTNILLNQIKKKKKKKKKCQKKRKRDQNKNGLSSTRILQAEKIDERRNGATPRKTRISRYPTSRES